MIVLGLDPSLTNFGWVVHDTEAVGKARVLGRGRWQTPAKMEFVARYMQMREWLREKIREYNPDRIGIEFPVFNDLWSEGMYGLFLFSCEAIKAEKKDVVFFSPGQIKAHAREFLVARRDRPKGPPQFKMYKPDMVEAARKDTGGKGKWNHNEADAYWAAYTAGRFWNLFEGNLEEDALTKPERQQFLKIHTFKRGKRAGKTVKSGIMHRESDRFFRWSADNTAILGVWRG